MASVTYPPKSGSAQGTHVVIPQKLDTPIEPVASTSAQPEGARSASKAPEGVQSPEPLPRSLTDPPRRHDNENVKELSILLALIRCSWGDFFESFLPYLLPFIVMFLGTLPFLIHLSIRPVKSLPYIFVALFLVFVLAFYMRYLMWKKELEEVQKEHVDLRSFMRCTFNFQKHRVSNALNPVALQSKTLRSNMVYAASQMDRLPVDVTLSLSQIRRTKKRLNSIRGFTCGAVEFHQSELKLLCHSDYSDNIVMEKYIQDADNAVEELKCSYSV